MRIFGGQSSGDTAGYADSQEQKNDDSNSNTNGGGSVAGNKVFKLDKASDRVDIFF